MDWVGTRDCSFSDITATQHNPQDRKIVPSRTSPQHNTIHNLPTGILINNDSLNNASTQSKMIMIMMIMMIENRERTLYEWNHGIELKSFGPNWMDKIGLDWIDLDGTTTAGSLRIIHKGTLSFFFHSTRWADLSICPSFLRYIGRSTVREKGVTQSLRGEIEFSTPATRYRSATLHN